MRARRTPLTLAAILAVAMSMAASSAPAGPEERAANVEEAAFLSLPAVTHVEFMSRVIDGATHHYALVGTRAPASEPGAGFNIVDITDPGNPVVAANVPCATTGGNMDSKAVAVEHTINGIDYDTIIALSFNDGSGCFYQNQKSGGVAFVGLRKTPDAGRDITADFLGSPIKTPEGGAFNAWKGPAAHTVVNHPTLPVLYTGNQMLADRFPTIEIFDLRVWPPVGIAHRFLPDRVTAGSGPHDITFSPDGTRAYAASITTTYVLDTSGDKLLAPAVVGVVNAPNLKIHHEAILHPDGRHLFVVDEFVATSGENVGQCPGGGIHIFDLGANHEFEAAPVPVGQFYAPDLSTPGIEEGPSPRLDISCTAHEYNFPPGGAWMPIAWYGAGARVLDLTSVVAAAELPAPTPVVVEEIGYFVPQGTTEFWAAKVHPGDPTYLVATDTPNGLRILHYTGTLPGTP